MDDPVDPTVEEQWLVDLMAGDRSFRLQVEGGNIRPAKVKAVRHGMYMRAQAIYGLFDHGDHRHRNRETISLLPLPFARKVATTFAAFRRGKCLQKVSCKVSAACPQGWCR